MQETMCLCLGILPGVLGLSVVGLGVLKSGVAVLVSGTLALILTIETVAFSGQDVRHTHTHTYIHVDT